MLLFCNCGDEFDQKYTLQRRLVGQSGGGEIISFIVLPPLRHTRWTGRPSRIEINQFFWKLFPVDFGFLKFLGNGDVFFFEKIAIRRYESNMHLDVGKNLANSKNWKVSRPNAACVHSI